MKQEIIDRIEAVAWELAEREPETTGPGFPLAVFAEVKQRAPEVIKHIERYRSNVDPYQVVASYVPRELCE